MAEIAAFRGVRYDTSRVDARQVLAPPYDVIEGDARAELAAMDPHNAVRLILPEGDGDAKYASAAQALGDWLESGVLVRDPRPALYRYHQVYSTPELGDEEVTRRGFIAAVRLHEFDERIIRRHERTLRGPKIDRLNLWDATSAHLSQIFTLYRDPSGEADRAFAAAEAEAPVLDGVTGDGTRHIVWRVDDPATIAEVTRILAPLPLYIADGHHRYETMLALRERIRERAGGLGPRSAAQFGMCFLANVDDPGLVVLPTHRMVHDVADFDRAALLARLPEYFELEAVPGGASDAGAVRDALARAAQVRTSFAAVFPGDVDATLLTLRADVDPAGLGLEGSAALLALDVTILHGLVLERLLGIDREAQEAKTNLGYVKDTGEALRLTAAGAGQVCFLMNATPVEQVVAVSDADDVMPQKSTFFYPKIASGTVIDPIDPDETL